MQPSANDRYILQRADFNALINILRSADYEVIAPVIQDGAIVYGSVEAAKELPMGWGDAQAPGRYRLRRRDDNALFGYAVGSDSWKRYLHPCGSS